MVFDVNSGPEQTKSDGFVARATGREFASFDAGDLVFLSVIVLVNDIINARFGHDASLPMCCHGSPPRHL